MMRLELRSAVGDREIITLMHPSLLVFADPARANENGTLWAWGAHGRPAAFLELYHFTNQRSHWTHAVTLTANHLVELSGVNSRWAPESVQIMPAPIPDSPQPGAEKAARLRQMKSMAENFTAHEFWDPNNSRFELRLLVQPILRYQDPAAEIQDGAAFVLAHGTNPEIILLIEAIGKSVDQSRWCFSAARLGSGEVHTQYNGKEVWQQDVARGPEGGRAGSPIGPYWVFFTPTE